MANFGLDYDLASLKGYDQLQRRLTAIGHIDKSIMMGLAIQANREQKKLLYTEAVTRRTGHSGQLITIGAVTDTHAQLIAQGTAAWADTGTRPHEITPKVAKVLAWGGARRLTGALKKGAKPTHFAARVHHPGTKAHHYMVKGAVIATRGVGILGKIVDRWNGAA